MGYYTLLRQMKMCLKKKMLMVPPLKPWMKSWFNLTLLITRVLKKEQPSHAVSGKHQREAARKTMQELVGLTSWGDVSQQDEHNPMRSQRLNSKILEHAEESVFAKGWFGFYLKCMCHQIIVVRGRMWLKNQKS